MHLNRFTGSPKPNCFEWNNCRSIACQLIIYHTVIIQWGKCLQMLYPPSGTEDLKSWTGEIKQAWIRYYRQIHVLLSITSYKRTQQRWFSLLFSTGLPPFFGAASVAKHDWEHSLIFVSRSNGDVLTTRLKIRSVWTILVDNWQIYSRLSRYKDNHRFRMQCSTVNSSYIVFYLKRLDHTTIRH